LILVIGRVNLAERRDGMKNAPQFLLVGAVILSGGLLASVALGRGGHHGGGGVGAAGGNLCISATLLELRLSSVDVILRTAGSQRTALDEVRKVAKQNSDDMSRVCGGDSPVSLPAKLTAAEKRLEAALTGARRLTPVAEKFYATLNDEQKAQANLLDWPGL
jgi:LTXXQ motif family protein